MKLFYDWHFYLDVGHLISLRVEELRDAAPRYLRNHKGCLRKSALRTREL